MDIADIRKNNIFAAPVNLATREEPEENPHFRSKFQRDRDRILYSKSFRRLSGKTQVFLTGSHDHVRNRLTHTLEVNQIASTTAKILGLDVELTEAVALGHDIGHAPFGHVGERTLNLIMNNCIKVSLPRQDLADAEKGFKHNLQGVRVFSDLHRIYPHLKATNLTNFTLYGIAKHSNLKYKVCEHHKSGTCYRRERVPCSHDGTLSVGFYKEYDKVLKIKDDDIYAWSFEADVVEYADEIAQRHHDVEDAYLMQILRPSDLLDKIEECFTSHMTTKMKKHLATMRNSTAFFGPMISQFLVNLYNTQLINSSRTNFQKLSATTTIKKRGDFLACYQSLDPAEASRIVCFSDDFKAADKCFQSFLKNSILNSHRAQRMDGKGSYLIDKLFKAYFTNPRQLHDSTILSVFNMLHGKRETVDTISKPVLGEYRNQIAASTNRADKAFENNLMRAICDHIAGMTDSFVIDEHARLYGAGTV